MDILWLGLIQINDWLLLFTVFLTTAYMYLTWNYDYFQKRGISGPKPYPLLGTEWPFFTKKGLVGSDIERREKYGHIYGTFFGRNPWLSVSDPEMLKAIFIKEHHNFINRRKQASREKFMTMMLTTAEGEQWRYLRTTLSPTFSTGKLRLMTKQINEAAESLVNNLQLEDGNEIPANDFSGAFTMDVIASTAFGLKVDSQKDMDNTFLKMSKKVFNVSFTRPFVIIMLLFPFLTPYLEKLGFTLIPKDVTNFFLEIIEKTMAVRKEGGQKRIDFLQLMMNAHKETGDDLDDHEQCGNIKETNNVSSRRGLTKDELLAQGLLFFLAGYDTTARSISFLMYLLALNPEHQQTLYDEIIRIIGDKDEIDYNMLCEMTFLDMCCHESLRMYPPGVRINRRANATTTINGLEIEKDLTISIPIYAIHMDPNIWQYPQTFDPYRFSAEEKSKHGPMDWLPFGAGPRNCPAMRLALVELKIAIVYMVKNFEILRGEKTEVPLIMRSGGMLQPKNGVFVKIEKRT